ncbi:9008_t:CDS:2 [Diversispora eburnea]|uniref:9008_t:CDS:1 n=1 Tax=Diversispora eburnea TaxID=1213867 RepID=A0A9N8ZK65_9GLOM|nr:9008_t:CDS:2 [Diversispora eburnea]
MTERTFETVEKEMEEEIQFYKEKIEILETEKEEIQIELEEFRITSHEYEDDLVHELEASEKRNSELKVKIETSNNEVNHWKTKYNQIRSDDNATTMRIEKMERELENLKEKKEMYNNQIRELELENDDLERITKSSLQDMEYKYNELIEQIAVHEIESEDRYHLTLEKIELEEKDRLIKEVQRLRNELRDVTLELTIKKNKEVNYEQPSISFKVPIISKSIKTVKGKVKKVFKTRKEEQMD